MDNEAREAKKADALEEAAQTYERSDSSTAFSECLEACYDAGAAHERESVLSAIDEVEAATEFTGINSEFARRGYQVAIDKLRAVLEEKA